MKLNKLKKKVMTKADEMAVKYHVGNKTPTKKKKK